MTNPINVGHIIQQCLLDGMSIDAAIKMASDKALAEFERIADARNEDEATGEAFTARFNGPIELTGDELDNHVEDTCECCKCCGHFDCECGYTEEEKMSAAGMSDEEIATTIYITELSSQLAEARDSVDSLLSRIDDLCGPDFHCFGSTPSWYVEAAAIACGIALNTENGAEDAGPTAVGVRDCDVPATLRAIELYATEDGNAIHQWFDGDAEMHQFLCALKVSVYAGADRLIKDDEGKTVGMWFYAHFGPTPVS